MALSGIHVAFGCCAVETISNTALGAQPSQATLLGPALASQTMAAGGTSTVSALQPTNGTTLPVMSVAASAAIFYAVGPAPNSSNSPRRYYDPSFGPLDIFVSVGDKIDWQLA